MEPPPPTRPREKPTSEPSSTDTHAVTRLAFANYFVARTGVDGNHKVCMLNMDPVTGDLSFDSIKAQFGSMTHHRVDVATCG